MHIAKSLPKALEPALVIDWRKSQRARAKVKATLKDALDALPESYSDEQYAQIVETLFEHIYESYAGEGQGKYGSVG